MSSLSILHLSDFHIGRFLYPDIRTLAVKLCDTLLERNKKVDTVVITGDIFDGRSEKYVEDRENAILFFNTFIDRMKSKEIVENSFTKEDILFIPGNHDLIRQKDREFEKYDLFIESFFGKKHIFTKTKFTDKYSFFYIHPEKKVIVIGFNSCKIEIEKIQSEELDWIKKIDLSKINKQDEIRSRIKNFKINEKSWEDYGYIDTIEMDDLFSTLRKEVANLNDYTIVATLHHHFYPFPEIVNKYSDTSLVRNYSEVVDKFQKNNVSIVLHGHKHLAIQRVVTDSKYFDDPDSIIYVLAGGSVGSKDVYNPSFQWLKVFDKKSNKLAQVERYDFKNQDLDYVKCLTLPPQKKEDLENSVKLLDLLETEDINLYKKYILTIDRFEQIIQDNDTSKIINIISGLITVFRDINQELKRNIELVFVLLICVHYRVIFLRKLRSSQNDLQINEAILSLKEILLETLNDTDYANNIIDLLEAKNNKDIDYSYEKVIKGIKASQKRYSAYISISMFITDLFLNISEYGENYFEIEKLNYKINIRLDKNYFYNNIPSQSINIKSDTDRRAIVIDFKCKNPTVHKIAVLIVKEFEIRLSKFEESLKEINLKLYYILPKVHPDKYDLENFNFDAYIPTLLPLLTGDNLYKQKEVFIRELVQNSIDAILLRKRLQPDLDFNDNITIEIGNEFRNTKSFKYFKIIDEGIGMSRFTIERYFTSIGRSFYVSEEFDELKRDNNISYQAISNFGIGFLSSFMVCKEIAVKTRNIFDISHGLEIEIPNYDGCFFIRNYDKMNYGTEITLYEDERNLFIFDEFIKYIKQTFLSIELTIIFNNKINVEDNFIIQPFSLHNNILNNIKLNKELAFYVPFSEHEGVKNISWIKDVYEGSNTGLDAYGIFIRFFPENKFLPINTFNQGLRISSPHSPIKLKNERFQIFVNYPSSFIQLDVAREKVNFLKKDLDNKIKQLILKQIDEFVIIPNELRKNMSINKLEIFAESVKEEFGKSYFKSLYGNYSLKVEKLQEEEEFRLSVIEEVNVPETYNRNDVLYINTENIKSIKNFLNTLKDNFSNYNRKLRNRDHLDEFPLLKTFASQIRLGDIHDLISLEIIRILTKYRKFLQKEEIDEVTGSILMEQKDFFYARHSAAESKYRLKELKFLLGSNSMDSINFDNLLNEIFNYFIFTNNFSQLHIFQEKEIKGNYDSFLLAFVALKLLIFSKVTPSNIDSSFFTVRINKNLYK